MKISKSIIELFGVLDFSILFKLFDKEGKPMSHEDAMIIKQACNEFTKDFKHLDLMKAEGPNFVRQSLGQIALDNGADWAKCTIRKDLSGDPRAYLEYGRHGDRRQLWSVALTRPTP